MNDALTDALAAALAVHGTRPDALLPLFHALQDRLGWVPPDAVPALADALNLSRAEVHGVLSFYPHFRRTRPGRHVMQICRAESCQAQGGALLEARALTLLGVDWHGTCTDGSVTLEPVFCLGQCAFSPALRVDDEVFARMDLVRLDALIAGLRTPESAP